MAPSPADISEWREPRATDPHGEKDPDNQVTNETLPLERKHLLPAAFHAFAEFVQEA